MSPKLLCLYSNVQLCLRSFSPPSELGLVPFVPRHYVIAVPLCKATDSGWSIVPVDGSYVCSATHNNRQCLDPWGTLWGMVVLNEGIHTYQWKQPIKINAKNMSFLYLSLICSLPFLYQQKARHQSKTKSEYFHWLLTRIPSDTQRLYQLVNECPVWVGDKMSNTVLDGLETINCRIKICLKIVIYEQRESTHAYIYIYIYIYTHTHTHTHTHIHVV